jgi:hypothetical protein
MVTVVQRPQGNKIIDQAVSATIINSSGDALVTFPYHSLSTGDIIYITSDIDEYNGFLYVEVIDSSTFKLRSNSLSDFIEFYQEIDIEYYQTQPHEWSSIFLPIVYKISNDRWPTNSVDTARTISSSSDDNGFTQLTLSGALKSQFNALEFVKIESASDEDLNNVWQIVEVISTSDIVINLPYDAANSFLGATIQYYYNNYQIKVKVYSGLDPGHPWQAKKPFEEMAELSLTPDENNEVMFSVSDYIKSKVAIKNNLTLFSLPLNLDAFTGFYIQTAESYDDSDNYSLFTTQSDFTQDSFNGYAIAGKLPFKNVYSGDYADYVYTSGSPAQWLTNRTRLLAVEDLYFDVSFIKNIMGNFFVRYMWYVSDYLTLTETVQFTDQGIGVYRIPVTANAVYDSVCIDVFKSATTGFTPAVMPAIDTWANLDTGGPAWAISATPEVDFNLLGLNVTSDTLYSDYAFEAGQIYSFGYTMEGVLCGSLIINIYDVSMNVLSSVTIPHTVSPQSGTYTFTAPAGATGIGLVLHENCSCGGIGDACVRKITAFTNDTTGGSTEPALAITEEICIDIIEQCDVADGITQDDRRLLEDGDFRLLE